MASEDSLDVMDNAVATAAVEPPAKKTRRPRQPKAATEVAQSAISAAPETPVKKTRAKRGSKVIDVKTSKPVARGSAKTVTKAGSEVKSAIPAVEPTDEFADLLKLEEENQSLRKQLSDKLRAENADLRKRLG